jgi:FkbM family methyltransferase
MVKQLLHKASQNTFSHRLSRLFGRNRQTDAPSESDVRSAYRALLGREPEDVDAIRKHMQAESLESLLQNIRTSAEFSEKERNHPFFHFNTRIDAAELIRRNALNSVKADARYLTNWFGVRVDPDVCPPMLKGRAGEIDPLPIPGNWHADMAEFAAVLRSVELAEHTFAMAELGCGWGCWMNNSGLVAKRRGLKVRLIGVEGDRGHLELAQKSLSLNGFKPEELVLLWGVAGPKSGTALFPTQDVPGSNWGLEAIYDANAETRAKALARGSHYEVPVLSLATIVDQSGAVLDLLHIDIQGGEADLIHSSLDLISRCVKYIVIGTHSREIEGRLFADLIPAGWQLEIERPAIIELNGHPKVVTDGVQGWRNVALGAPDPGLSKM